MTQFSFGVPSRFTEWCETVLAELVSARFGASEVHFCESLGQLAEAHHHSEHAVARGREPNVSLSRRLMALGQPMLVVLDAPEQALGTLITDHRIGYTEAVRRVANSLVSLLPLLRYERALMLKAADHLPVRQIAQSISDHFGLEADESTVGRIAGTHPMPAAIAGPDERFAPEPLAGFEDLVRPKRIAAVASLWEHVNGEPLTEIVWAPALFRVGGARTAAPTYPIDLSGESRCIVFGPYLRVPEGRWSCRVEFACSERAHGLPLVVEVGGPETFSTARVVLGAGVHAVECSFDNAEPDALIEVRLLTAQEALHGELLFGRVVLKPAAAQ